MNLKYNFLLIIVIGGCMTFFVFFNQDYTYMAITICFSLRQLEYIL